MACGAVGCTLQWAAANILDFGKVCEVYSRIYASLCPLAGTRGEGEQVHQREGELHQGRRLLGLHIYRSAAVQTVGFGEVLHLFAVLTCDQPRRSVGDGLEGDRGLFACKGDVSLQGEQLQKDCIFSERGR